MSLSPPALSFSVPFLFFSFFFFLTFSLDGVRPPPTPRFSPFYKNRRRSPFPFRNRRGDFLFIFPVLLVDICLVLPSFFASKQISSWFPVALVLTPLVAESSQNTELKTNFSAP